MNSNEEVKTELNIPYGYCHCGCGEKTEIAKQSVTKLNQVKGEHFKFIHGHKKLITTCKSGRHLLTPENTYQNNKCRLCRNERAIKYYYESDKPLERAKLYQKTEKGRANKQKTALKQRTLLSNWYIASKLNLSVSEAPSELIELKRMMIQLTRAKRAYLKGERLNGYNKNEQTCKAA